MTNKSTRDRIGDSGPEDKEEVQYGNVTINLFLHAKHFKILWVLSLVH